ADLVLIDLDDTAYLPYNSAARQVVYTENGRGVDSVMTDGRMVMEEGRVTTIDEEALRKEVRELMKFFIRDYEKVVETRARALPFMQEAHRRMWEGDVGMNRFINPGHRDAGRLRSSGALEGSISDGQEKA